MERDASDRVTAVVLVTPAYRPYLPAGAAVTVAIASKLALGLSDALALMVLATVLASGLLGTKALAATRSKRREVSGSVEELVDAVIGSLNGGYCELHDGTIVLRDVERTVAVRLHPSGARQFVQRYYARVSRDAGAVTVHGWARALQIPERGLRK